MSRHSTGSVLLVSFVLLIFAAIIMSVVGGDYFQWIFVPVAIIVCVWAAQAMGRGRKPR